MADTRIYRPGQEQLSVLLHHSTGPEGATLLIPDLQRPFRWSPRQVTLLIDSLMRGWPFGTLLLWAIDDKQVGKIPWRTFWRQVDRVDRDGGTKSGPLDPPVPRGYRMVLDGQQRLQSLIVALSGGDAGFRLEDREWWSALDPDRAKGRAGKHWSLGALCLDLEEYARQRADKRVQVQHVDYSRALQWVVCAARDGRSEFKKPVNYEEPLRTQSEHAGRFIRLSRLWEMAVPGHPALGELMERLSEELLPAHQVPADRIPKLVTPLLELVVALGQVKQTEVSFLELRPYEAGRFDPEQYGTAVVNIFTRLNAGGRALSEEEITFAWIKTGWRRESPTSADATTAFEDLQRALREEGLDLTMDKIVQAVSVIWAVVERDGKLLRQSDLLLGDKVGPMAAGLSQRWSRISENLVDTAKLLKELGLAHGDQYESLNAFITLAAWRFVGMEWVGREKPQVPVVRNVTVRLDTLLRQHATRFLLLTSWAGHWSGGAVNTFEKYAAELAEDHAAGRGATQDVLLKQLEVRIDRWLADAIPLAEDHVMRLEAGRRDDVRWYYVPLWAWHRLDFERSLMSEGLNVPKSRKALSIDVDHVVSFASWSRRLTAGEGSPEWDNDVNHIGNCFLLQKNFNISKSDQPLKDFLDQMDEFKEEDARRRWAAAMALPREMVEPGSVTLDQVRAHIAQRTTRIKEDLAAFVRNEKRLGDGETRLEVAGEWNSAFQEKTTKTDAPLLLKQDGERVFGTYGKDGRIEATLRGNRLRGTWTELDSAGAVAWVFTADGSSFTGTWGYNRKAAGAGEWSGTRKGNQPVVAAAATEAA